MNYTFSENQVSIYYYKIINYDYLLKNNNKLFFLGKTLIVGIKN